MFLYLREVDLSADGPAWLYVHGEYLVPDGAGVSVLVHNPARDLHLLHTAEEDLLQAHGELLLDGRVLSLLASAVQSTEAHRHVAIHAIVEL